MFVREVTRTRFIRKKDGNIAGRETRRPQVVDDFRGLRVAFGKTNDGS
jgi:hypothetical protein